MVYRYLLLLIFFLFSNLITLSQELYPELSKKIDYSNTEKVASSIEQLYRKSVKADQTPSPLLQLWAFSLYDSLGLESKADSMAFILIPSAEKLAHPKSSKIFLVVGSHWFDRNEFEKAISNYHKGLKIAKRYNDLMNCSKLNKSVGITYLQLDDYKTAEKYLKEAVRFARLQKDDLLMAGALISLGNAVKEQGELNQALIYYEKSLSLAVKINDKRLIAGNYNNLGNTMRRMEQPTKALAYFQKALLMNKESGNKLWESFNYHNIGNCYNDIHQYGKAIENLKLSNQLKEELKDSASLVSGYEVISLAYYNNQDYKNAYNFLLQSTKVKNSLHIHEQADLIKELEAKYESEKNQAEIEHLKMSQEMQQMKNDVLQMQATKNKNISILSIIAALCLVVGVGILFRSNQKRKEINSILYQKNNDIETANSALQLALNELSLKNKEVIDSINYATYIQQATLPNISQVAHKLLNFELFFAPKDIVSGDFYFSYQLYQKSFFGVADCTGHGVPGAMVSLIGMNSLDKVVREEKHESSATMVDSLNKHVNESLQRGGDTINDGMDISFCYLDHAEQMLHFTGANHHGLILRKNTLLQGTEINDRISLRLKNENYSLFQLAGARRPIGHSTSTDSFFEVQIEMKPSDRIILFSDGFADQIGGVANKKLKKGALLSLLLSTSGLPVQEQLSTLKSDFSSWKGTQEQVDDVCLLIVEIQPDLE